MEKEDIGKYVLSGLKRGLPLEEIKQQLLSRNCSDYDINEEISKLDLKNVEVKKEENPTKEKTESIKDWDKGVSKS